MAIQPSPPPKPRRPGFLSGLRANFLTGIIVIAPIGLTVWLIWTVVGWFDSWVLPLVPYELRPERWIGINFRGVGVVFFLLFTMVVGWLAKGYIGRRVIRTGERMVDRMPVVRSVYGGVKQIAETVFAQTEASFEHACLIEYPRQDVWAIAFISTHAKGEIAAKTPGDERMVSVFVPTTPNPTSGFILFLRESQVRILDMSIEDAAKLVISAGLVYPAPKAPPESLPSEDEAPPPLPATLRGRIAG